jgi:hypothetical protein
MADPVTMALMAGGSLVKGIGSIFAGRAQKAAAKKAGGILQQGYGNEAANALLMPETVNPGISDAYQKAQGYVGDVYNRSGDDLIGAGRTANEYLNPYIVAGGNALTSVSSLAQAPEERFTGQGLEMDPGYAFRQAEGLKALERSAASRGIGQTGGTLKALTRYGQDMASQEYQNAFQRSLDAFKTNQAGRQQRFSNLSGLMQTGYGASGAAGQNLIGAQQTAGGWRNTAAQLQGGYGIDSATQQANNAMKYGDMARNLRLGGVQSEANSILGVGQATADMWSGGANAIGGGMQMAGAMGGWGGRGTTPGSYPNLPGGQGGYNYPADWYTYAPRPQR